MKKMLRLVSIFSILAAIAIAFAWWHPADASLSRNQVFYPGNTNNTSSASGEYCYFTAPQAGWVSWGQLAGVDSAMDIPAGGFPGGVVPEDIKQFSLAWEALNKDGQPISEQNGYSAVLSSPGISGGRYSIGSTGVSVNGSQTVSLGGTFAEAPNPGVRNSYTVSIRKNGSEVASCKLIVDHSYTLNSGKHGPNSVAAGSFPAEGSYLIPSGSSTFSAVFGFSDPWVGPSLESGSSLADLYGNINVGIGQFRKGIFMTRTHIKGPTARWDLSDPLHPKNPQGIDGLGGSPAIGSGPFRDTCWGHEGNMGPIRYVEAVGGDGRIFVDYSNYFCGWQHTANFNFDAEGNLSLTGKYSDKYLNSSSGNSLYNSGILVETPSGNFFNYISGETSTKVFDVTNTSLEVPIEHSTTISWGNVREFAVLQYPGNSNQYLVGRMDTTSLGRTTVKVGKINAETGQVAGTKTQTIAGAPGDMFTNIQPVYVGGKIYVIVTDRFPLNSTSGSLRLGIYQLNTTTLTLTRTGQITLSNISAGQWRQVGLLHSVINSEDGKGYPVLEIANGGGQSGGEVTLNFYSLKNLLAASTMDPQRAFQITTVPHPAKLIKGDTVVDQWPTKDNAFIKREGGKYNLYLYRVASMIEGYDTYAKYPYEYQPFDTIFGYVPPTGVDRFATTTSFRVGTYRGDMGFRVDRIDVTSLVSNGSSPTPSTPIPPITPPANTGLPTLPGPLPGGGTCDSKYSSLCDQLDSLRRSLCKLVPTLEFCQALVGGGGL
jgi:hypothetical protein